MPEEKMSSDEIRFAIEKLQLERCLIAAQIDGARASSISGGVPLDHAWLASAESAKRFKGLRIGQLQRQLSEVLKEERASKKSFSQVFVEIARKMLPQDMFERIVSEAISEMNSEQS